MVYFSHNRRYRSVRKRFDLAWVSIERKLGLGSVDTMITIPGVDEIVSK